MFASDVILREVGCRRDYMCNFSNFDTSIGAGFRYCCSIFFEYRSKLCRMSEGFNMTGEVLTSRAFSIVNSLLVIIAT